jgi:hypothetical protein
VRHGFGGPGSPVEHLGLDGGEERLGHRVVPALTLAPHRQAHAKVVGEITEPGGGVLGEFNRSSQHLDHRGGSGTTTWMGRGSDGQIGNAIAGSAAGVAA